jgi:hypothetical protein
LVAVVAIIEAHCFAMPSTTHIMQMTPRIKGGISKHRLAHTMLTVTGVVMSMILMLLPLVVLHVNAQTTNGGW